MLGQRVSFVLPLFYVYQARLEPGVLLLRPHVSRKTIATWVVAYLTLSDGAPEPLGDLLLVFDVVWALCRV